MEKYEELLKLIESLKGDVDKIYSKKVKAASVRVRKSMQDIRQLALEIRKDISETIKSK